MHTKITLSRLLIFHLSVTKFCFFEEKNLNEIVAARSTFLKMLIFYFRQIRGIDNWKLAIISTNNFGPLTLWLPHVIFDFLTASQCACLLYSLVSRSCFKNGL